MTRREADDTHTPSAETAPDDDAVEAGRLLFARPITFVKGVVEMTGLPPADRREVAFAGRSNVGKSSLINTLTGRKALARASNAPGRTRELNFFDLDSQFYLVDLPGYGFARAPREAVERWTSLTRDYLRGRATLSRVYLLIDSRHGLKEADREVMSALDTAAVSYHIVLTKIDKLTPPAAAARHAEVTAAISKRPAAFPNVVATSSAKGHGIAELRAHIAQIPA